MGEVKKIQVEAKHGRQLNQKMKPYVVLQYLMKETDENHLVTAYDIVGYLEACGIDAERRSIYKDIEAINRAVLMLEEECTIQEAEEMLEDEENDDILLLDGTELDLDEVVTEAFVLAMDTKNLCSDDCKGLCAGCGVNLNEEPCRCRPEVDPRLAALAQLLDKDAE